MKKIKVKLEKVNRLYHDLKKTQNEIVRLNKKTLNMLSVLVEEMHEMFDEMEECSGS